MSGELILLVNCWGQMMAPKKVAPREKSMLMEIVRVFPTVEMLAAMRAGWKVGHSAAMRVWMMASATLWDLTKWKAMSLVHW